MDKVLLYTDFATLSNRAGALHSKAHKLTAALTALRGAGFVVEHDTDILHPEDVRKAVDAQIEAQVANLPPLLRSDGRKKIYAAFSAISLPTLAGWMQPEDFECSEGVVRVAKTAENRLREQCSVYVDGNAQLQVYKAADALKKHIEWFTKLVKDKGGKALTGVGERNAVLTPSAKGWEVNGYAVASIPTTEIEDPYNGAFCPPWMPQDDKERVSPVSFIEA